MHKTWYGMIERCYAEKYKDKYPAYHGIVTVKESWLNYQNFAKWYIENEYPCNERLSLDKDILMKDSKLYSEKTCLLIPQRINLIFMKSQRKRDPDLPVGINRLWRKDGSFRYQSMFNGKTVGTFDTLEEAEQKYLTKKREHIKRVADDYKKIIPKKIYDALINW